MRLTRVNDPAKQALEEAQAAAVEQTKADVDYIAMMTGVIIEDEEVGIDE